MTSIKGKRSETDNKVTTSGPARKAPGPRKAYGYPSGNTPTRGQRASANLPSLEQLLKQQKLHFDTDEALQAYYDVPDNEKMYRVKESQKKEQPADHHILEGHERVFVPYPVRRSGHRDVRNVSIHPSTMDAALRLAGEEHIKAIRDLARQYFQQPQIILSHMTCAEFPYSRLRVVLSLQRRGVDLNANKLRLASHGEAKYGSFGNAERALTLLKQRRTLIESGKLARDKKSPTEEFGILMWAYAILQREAPSVQKAVQYNDEMEADPEMVRQVKEKESGWGWKYTQDGTRMYAYLVKVICRFWGKEAGQAALSVLARYDPMVLEVDHSKNELRAVTTDSGWRFDHRYGPDVFCAEHVMEMFGSGIGERYRNPSGTPERSVVELLVSSCCDFLGFAHAGDFQRAVDLFKRATFALQDLAHGDLARTGKTPERFHQDRVFAEAAGLLLDFSPTYEQYIRLLRFILAQGVPLAL